MSEWNSIVNIEECNPVPPLNTWVEVCYKNDTPFTASLKAPQNYGEMGGDWSNYHWCVKLPDQVDYAPLETFTKRKLING